MISLWDAVTLARTKRRTRRIRGAFTTAIAGLLFSFLMGAVIIVGGVESHLSAMYEKSMTGRYIIGGYQWSDYTIYNTAAKNSDLIAQVQVAYDQRVAAKKAAAKKLGISYDSSSEPLPYDTTDKSNGEKILSSQSPIASELMSNWIQQRQPTRTLDDFKKFAGAYHPSAYYTALSFSPKNGQWLEMKDGKESFEQDTSQQTNMNGPPSDYLDMKLAPEGLVKNYLLPSYQWQASSGHIPVVVTQKRAAQLTNFSPPKEGASDQEKLQYYQKLREKVNGKTMTLCYRNNESAARINEAIATKKLVAAHAGERDYQKPALLYDTPDPASCGDVIISSDTRSAAEKTLADKQLEFDKQFGAHDPLQRKIILEVVGVSPNGWEEMDSSFSTGMGDMISAMLMTQAFRMTVPTELYQKIPASFEYASLFGTTTTASDIMSMIRGGNVQYFAEFTSAGDARDFAKRESCQYTNTGACAPADKWFALSAYGSNSLAIEEASHYARTILMWAGLVIMVLAAVFASLMIGRTIADSRRETAVFRAIGFKRLDITSVYMAYTFFLCFDIVLLMVVIGAIGAVLLDHFLWVDTTARLQVLLGLTDSTAQFHYYGLSWYVVVVIVAVFAAGLIGLIPPLLRSIRRNPIRDMRDE